MPHLTGMWDRWSDELGRPQVWDNRDVIVLGTIVTSFAWNILHHPLVKATPLH
jgi:hypothetical protein